ncbi:MAG: DUF4124 domain-containing protein [Woeseiaceae bacterium]|nr:DUF4124 domain-containing protein [Woeseiaceae bacterium]
METRAILALLGLIVAAAAAADVWRWVDDDGVVHFSDTPVEGAERIDVSESSRTTGARVFTPPPQPGVDSEPVVEEEFRYESLEIASPGAEETLWNIEGTLSVSLALTPGLQSGHQVRVYFDGEPRMVNSTSFTINEVWRGVHNIQAEVLDETGALMIRSQPSRFYVQQNRVRGPR